jgi:peptidoglycan/LPS O-acetylase OafA/YrhL
MDGRAAGALREREPRVRAAAPARRGELDALRALVVVGLVFFHTAVIFGAGEFPVKAEAENRVVTVLIAFGATWGMPLLFLISGMGARYSLRSRDAGAFARERLRRLGAPLLVGLLTLVPLQVYLGLRRAGDPASLGGFYARFWDLRPALDFPSRSPATGSRPATCGSWPACWPSRCCSCPGSSGCGGRRGRGWRSGWVGC